MSLTAPDFEELARLAKESPDSIDASQVEAALGQASAEIEAAIAEHLGRPSAAQQATLEYLTQSEKETLGKLVSDLAAQPGIAYAEAHARATAAHPEDAAQTSTPLSNVPERWKRLLREAPPKSSSSDPDSTK